MKICQKHTQRNRNNIGFKRIPIIFIITSPPNKIYNKIANPKYEMIFNWYFVTCICKGVFQ
jgi:hypothetical protein